MSELGAKFQLGAAKGDTFNNQRIVRVIADGKYVYVPDDAVNPFIATLEAEVDFQDVKYTTPGEYSFTSISGTANPPAGAPATPGKLIVERIDATNSLDMTLVDVFTGRKWKQGYPLPSGPHGGWTETQDRAYAQPFSGTSALGANATAVAAIDGTVSAFGDSVANLASITDGPAGLTGAGAITSKEYPTGTGRYRRELIEFGTGAVYSNYWDGASWGGWQGGEVTASNVHTVPSLTSTADANHSMPLPVAGDIWLAAHRQEYRQEKLLLDIATNGVLALIAPDGTPVAGYKKSNASKAGPGLTLSTQTDAGWPLHEPIYYSNLGDTADTITPGTGIQLHNEAGAAVGALSVDPFSTMGLVKTAPGIVEIISFGDTDANAALTATLDPSNLNPGAVEEFEVPFAGAVAGDAFVPASPLDIGDPANGFFQATANFSRNDFVRVVVRNNDVVAHDLPSSVWRIYKVNHRLPSPTVAGVQALVGGTGVTIGGTATNPQIDFSGAAVLERTFAQISAQSDSINQAALKTRNALVYISDRDVYVRPSSALTPTGPWKESGTTVDYVVPA